MVDGVQSNRINLHYIISFEFCQNVYSCSLFSFHFPVNATYTETDPSTCTDIAHFCNKLLYDSNATSLWIVVSFLTQLSNLQVAACQCSGGAGGASAKIRKLLKHKTWLRLVGCKRTSGGTWSSEILDWECQVRSATHSAGSSIIKWWWHVFHHRVLTKTKSTSTPDNRGRWELRGRWKKTLKVNCRRSKTQRCSRRGDKCTVDEATTPCGTLFPRSWGLARRLTTPQRYPMEQVWRSRYK